MSFYFQYKPSQVGKNITKTATSLLACKVLFFNLKKRFQYLSLAHNYFYLDAVMDVMPWEILIKYYLLLFEITFNFFSFHPSATNIYFRVSIHGNEVVKKFLAQNEKNVFVNVSGA